MYLPVSWYRAQNPRLSEFQGPLKRSSGPSLLSVTQSPRHREMKDATHAALCTRTEGAASGARAVWVEPVLCLFPSVFPAWIRPMLVWGLVTGTCCLPAMLFCQLIGSFSYCLGTGYTAGTPYKVPPTQSNTAPPPYSPSPNPYQTAMYPIRSAYPQQNLYAQVGTCRILGSPLLQVKEPPAWVGGVEGEEKKVCGSDQLSLLCL